MATNNIQVVTPTDTSVDTFGWDTAYIAPFPVVNQAIMKQQSYPKQFNYSDVTKITISGNWTSWQLTPGGAGGDVQMICEVQSGTAAGREMEGDLKGSKLLIQVKLKAVAATDPINDPTAKDQGKPQKLIINTSGVGLDPAVSVISGEFPNITDDLLKDVLPSIFSKYFNEKISEFGHVFAVMNLNEVADKDGFQWLKPTAFQYAVASPEDGSLENSAFGLIAMVQNHPVPPTMQQAVDVRALLNLPKGANSSFVISETMVAQNMLLHGAISTIQGSSASDFGFSADGLSVTNVKDLVWGNFATKGGIISPAIAKNNFTMRADDTYVYLEIADAKYETSPGITVHMNLTQKFTYTTVRAENGNYVFIPDITGFGNPSITANVSVAESLQIANIVVMAVGAVAGLLCAVGGFAVKIVEGVAVTVDEAANTAEIVMGEEVMAEAIAESPELLTTENEAGAAAADAGAAAPADSSLVQNCGIFTSTQFRAGLGLITAIAGFTPGIGTQIAQLIASKKYNDIPAFDNFAANCMGASVWPGLSDYKLIGASFRSSLVMALAMDAAS
ncbi:TULIP family P47-like protein [Burkholderia sp. TSV86]|uniref:TULIP family P47-like protein n=1 Tax=Burkholderia sp. TSV86 TaxID=1385594 RepID=UPI0009E99071|nr:TULIP family P47-like protein [Burkholderia sp. TSV86]